MQDSYGRKIEYLRLSVTDACNLRCSYCMPDGAPAACSCKHNLSADEFEEIVRAAVSLGVKKLRITGGEPLVRNDIVSLCRRLSSIEGIEDFSMTTNASLLAPIAKELYDAGLHRINISLDTLDAAKYAEITRGGKLSDAVRGIRAAMEAGMKPVKLNTVLIGGFNDDEIVSLANLTRLYPVDVRFIELMPIGDNIPFAKEAFIKNSTVLEKCPDLIPAEGEKGAVAKMYRFPDGKGRVGLISPLSNHFCAECSRLRLTADGCLKPCLHSADEISVRGLHGDELKERILTAVSRKPKMHVELSATEHSKSQRNMYRIGG